MFSNYLLSAWRHLKRNKMFTVLFTVSLQTLKAARANPVHSLRSE
jgi:hypothetical protein